MRLFLVALLIFLGLGVAEFHAGGYAFGTIGDPTPHCVSKVEYRALRHQLPRADLEKRWEVVGRGHSVEVFGPVGPNDYTWQYPPCSDWKVGIHIIVAYNSKNVEYATALIFQ